ncbi:MAG: Mth938-like domain-containing protein [Geminicoccaceae bacterium]|nr:Mth938-like domain-containing protein [Geminicoccaceae bacterium]
MRPVPTGERPFVRAYGPGGFTIGATRFAGSLLLLPDRIERWCPVDPEALVAEDLKALQPLTGGAVSLLVLGLGATARPLPPALLAELRSWGLAVEAVATPAACRTWNLLLAEGRPAAAALVALPSTD